MGQIAEGKSHSLVEEARKYNSVEEFQKAMESKPIKVNISKLEESEPLQRTGPSRTKGPIKVWQDIKTGKMTIEDGHNRVYEAGQRGEKVIDAIITPTMPEPGTDGAATRYAYKELYEKANKELKTKFKGFSEIVYRGGQGTSPNGVFYSPEKKVAEAYAKRKGGGVISQKVELSNPLKIPADHDEGLDQIHSDLIKKGDTQLATKFKKAIDRYRSESFALLPEKQRGEMYEKRAIEVADPLFAEYAKKYGYDGILRYDGKKLFEIVDFKSKKTNLGKS
jgi:hypothetical protein